MVVHCSIAYPFSENGICDSAKTDIPFGGMAYAIFRPLPPRTGHWIFPRVSAIFQFLIFNFQFDMRYRLAHSREIKRNRWNNVCATSKRLNGSMHTAAQKNNKKVVTHLIVGVSVLYTLCVTSDTKLYNLYIQNLNNYLLNIYLIN